MKSLCTFALLLCATDVWAQVVQLPTQQNFNITGSVLVPDGGTAAFGGVGYATQGSARSGFGPRPNRSVGGNIGGSSVSVSAQIIDLDALDEAILNGSPATSAGASSNPRGSGVASGSNAPRSVDAADIQPGTPTQGVSPQSSPLDASARNLSPNTSARVDADPGRWQRVLSGESTPTAVNPSLQESNVRYYVQQGERAEKSGSYQAARVYYRLARQAMTPELRERYERTVANRIAAAAARTQALDEEGRRKF